MSHITRVNESYHNTNESSHSDARTPDIEFWYTNLNGSCHTYEFVM